VYDPRLTSGGPRHEALKCLGQKHLVYFLMCEDSPFAVLGEVKIMAWDDGLVADLHLGRMAKNHSKARFASFQSAMQIAMIEQGKRPEQRLEWTHTESTAPVELGTDNEQLSKTKRVRRRRSVNSSIGEDIKTVDICSQSPTASSSGSSRAAPLNLVCSVFEYGETRSTGGTPMGFVILPNQLTATFAEARLEVDRQGLEMPTRWRFFIPNLGPITFVQESTLGPMQAFLKQSNPSSHGEGTFENPVKVYFVNDTVGS
jgi:hypothetical protein